MSTITETVFQENGLVKRITGFFEAHKASQILRESNAYAGNGIPMVRVLIYLTHLVFTKKSMYEALVERFWFYKFQQAKQPIVARNLCNSEMFQ